jgi:hypothetical protein
VAPLLCHQNGRLGYSVDELMAWFGWSSAQTPMRYVADAEVKEVVQGVTPNGRFARESRGLRSGAIGHPGDGYQFLPCKCQRKGILRQSAFPFDRYLMLMRP